MSNEIEYIEAYFTQSLSDAEKRMFEERCVQDQAFAGEVAFYISSREAVRQQLLEQKKVEWAKVGEPTSDGHPIASAPLRKMIFAKWLPYAAAACLILVFSIYFFSSSQSHNNLATNLIQENYIELSQNMDASGDELQQGIAEYNKKEYNRALALFENFYRAHPENSDAKQYIGLSYLMQKEYDKALVNFDELSQKKGLLSNPGLFLTALTYLQRNKGNDQTIAKKLLEQVVAQKLEHYREAGELLDKW